MARGFQGFVSARALRLVRSSIGSIEAVAATWPEGRARVVYQHRFESGTRDKKLGNGRKAFAAPPGDERHLVAFEQDWRSWLWRDVYSG